MLDNMVICFLPLYSIATRYTHEEGFQEFRSFRPAGRLQGHDADGNAGDISPV